MLKTMSIWLIKILLFLAVLLGGSGTAAAESGIFYNHCRAIPGPNHERVQLCIAEYRVLPGISRD
jgi:hypothetical protein